MNRKKKLKLDPLLEKFYSLGKERNRLNSAMLEKDRTLRILAKEIPPPPLTVYDIGGAYGVYSYPLAQRGYKVHLIDPIPIHIEQAKKYGKNFPSIQLKSLTVGDARNIEKPDESADVILFFGPLYHLTSSSDRLKALKEAYRCLKKGGLLFATAISRFQTYLEKMHHGTIISKFKVVEHDYLTGMHQSENSNMCIYFHSPQAFKAELGECGFKSINLLGVEGPVWHPELLQKLQKEPKEWEKLLDFLELIEKEESIIGASAHFIAITKK